ncbi:hypothetical protein GCM10027046_17560 [Uliginosibacterium flavum]|uniref:Uncharacterized protein n=1 Tax=Uliginosibacterium flavum TaxID=1396831 RepID=A0ABV2TF96_9RHOO
MARISSAQKDSVFINCPFSDDYKELFHCIIFCVLACGFRPRSALEAGDAGDIRLEKIVRLIKESHYSIHDLSAVELDKVNNLPRFNMPFELGLVIGCKKVAGDKYANRPILVMEHNAYTSQKCLSDIAGQDLQAHQGSAKRVTRIVRTWLLLQSNRTDIPGHVRVQRAFEQFYEVLPELCDAAGLDSDEVSYPDFVYLTQQWLVEQNAASAT